MADAAEIDIEGLTLAQFRALPREDRAALTPFGRALVFRLGSARILGEFLERADTLVVNLAQIDGGGEGVLLRLWKLIIAEARDRGFKAIRWNVFAATCVDPNPRLQAFLRANRFEEAEDAEHGRIFVRSTRIGA